MIQVLYVGVPNSVRKEVQDIITQFASTIPGWLNQLTVEYLIKPESGSDLDGSIACIEVAHEYRHAKMRIHGDQWNRPDVDKRRVIVHELMHCPVSPLETIAYQTLDQRDEAAAAEELDPMLQAMYEQVRIALEGCVEDVAKAVVNAYDAGMRAGKRSQARRAAKKGRTEL